MASSLEQELRLGGVWRRAAFTVPSSVSEARVATVFDRYMRRFGDALERMGFTVVAMTTPQVHTAPSPTDADRRRYILWAFVRRRPTPTTFDVPDAAVPSLTALGYKLTE